MTTWALQLVGRKSKTEAKRIGMEIVCWSDTVRPIYGDETITPTTKTLEETDNTVSTSSSISRTDALRKLDVKTRAC